MGNVAHVYVQHIFVIKVKVDPDLDRREAARQVGEQFDAHAMARRLNKEFSVGNVEFVEDGERDEGYLYVKEHEGAEEEWCWFNDRLDIEEEV